MIAGSNHEKDCPGERAHGQPIKTLLQRWTSCCGVTNGLGQQEPTVKSSLVLFLPPAARSAQPCPIAGGAGSLWSESRRVAKGAEGSVVGLKGSTEFWERTWIMGHGKWGYG